MMAKTAAERQRARRGRVRESRGRQICITLDEDAIAALERLCAATPGCTYGAVISKLLLHGVAPVKVDLKYAKLQAKAEKDRAKAERQAAKDRIVELRLQAQVAEIRDTKPVKGMDRRDDGVFGVTSHDTE